MNDDKNKYAHAMPYQYQFKNPEIQMQQLQMDLMGEQIMSEDEQRITSDLKDAYQKNVASLELFLQREYSSFQNKVFKCVLNRCYNDIYQDRQNISICKQECTASIVKIQEFTHRQFNTLHDKFNTCMTQSQKQGFTLENSFRCYDELFNDLENVKLIIRQENNYYQ